MLSVSSDVALAVHGISTLGASEVGQAGSRYETARRFGMIDRHEQAPWRRARVDRIVVEAFRRHASIDERLQRHSGDDGIAGQREHGLGVGEQSQRRFIDASDAPGRTLLQLHDPGHRSRVHLHLMLQPMLGRCSGETARPAMTASSAARRSFPVTGTSFPGRLSSS